MVSTPGTLADNRIGSDVIPQQNMNQSRNCFRFIGGFISGEGFSGEVFGTRTWLLLRRD
jgi:hypothetical protein